MRVLISKQLLRSKLLRRYLYLCMFYKTTTAKGVMFVTGLCTTFAYATSGTGMRFISLEDTLSVLPELKFAAESNPSFIGFKTGKSWFNYNTSAIDAKNVRLEVLRKAIELTFKYNNEKDTESKSDKR